MPFSSRRHRLPALAFVIAAAFLLTSCGSKPQSPPPAAAAATAPVVVTPPVTVSPLGAAPPPAPPTGAVTGNRIGVGLLLPLSGPSAPLGQAILEASEMALYDLGGDRLELLVRDSGGTPEMASSAARSAITGGAQLLLGPLLAAEVEAAKPIAAAAHVPLVAFSTATQLAGDGTWLMSFDPRQEIQRVVIYAHQHGHNRFATLAPDGPYGDLAVAALQQAVTQAGATMGRVARYASDATDLGPDVQDFANDPDYDAVLLPEGGGRLKALAPLLPFYGVDLDQVKLLGTGLWADSTIGTEPSLDGGWYAAPNPATRADFERRFESLYHNPPPLLATLGYDATALAAVLAKAPNGPNFTAAALTNPSGFSGLNGIFRLLPNGIVERGLAVLDVERAGATVIDPAPQSFEKPGGT